MAVANYRSAYKCYPPAFITDEHGNRMHSWRSVLLPFIEQQELYKEYDFSKPWNSPENMRLADRMPATYATNYQKGKVTTNYLAIVGPETIWRTNEDGSKALPRRSSEVSDDRDSTLLFVENFGKEVHWLSPYDLEFDEMSFELDDPMGISSYYKDPQGQSVFESA